jgi:hypothetical protein
VLNVGYFGKQNRNSSDILKCGAGEGGRRSVEVILCATTKYYIETRKRGITYK